MRVFFQDEARFGLHLPCRRRLTARGVAPKQLAAPIYESYWLYGAVEPATGESHFWEMGSLDGEGFSLFLAKLSIAFADTLNVVVIDGAGAHTGGRVVVPPNVVLMRLPPYCPELNPIERLWQAVRSRIDVNDALVRTDLVVLQAHVWSIIESLGQASLSSLTLYDYIAHALNALR